MKVTICIGSSCHLKGSREVVEGLQKLVEEHNLVDQVTLNGAFCMGNCVNGVSVKIDDQIHSVKPNTVKEFFETEVLPRVK
ncbi:MAG: (2Fe-2S) ferredoxin domain-containing protein [Firmicutes bacterium]|nr:(2Fe-2S) ferredoxin domain-containing protein [Bacillota bacterium]